MRLASELVLVSLLCLAFSLEAEQTEIQRPREGHEPRGDAPTDSRSQKATTNDTGSAKRNPLASGKSTEVSEEGSSQRSNADKAIGESEESSADTTQNFDSRGAHEGSRKAEPEKHASRLEGPKAREKKNSEAPSYSDWAAIISSLCAVAGLFYAGYQFRSSARSNRQVMYVGWLEKYFRLKELIIEYPEIEEIYTRDIEEADLTPRQRHYIFCVLAFCEAIYQTGQIQSFPEEVPGASWENYIIHQLRTPSIKKLWDASTQPREQTVFTGEFIDWVSSRNV